MVLIRFTKSSQCSWYERHLVAWYDDVKDEIVVIEDHPRTNKELPNILKHEIEHWRFNHNTPDIVKAIPLLHYIVSLFVEEPLVWKRTRGKNHT